MIPKIIHQIWSEKKMPLPDLYKRLGETWKSMHPGWKYMLWDDLQMKDFIYQYYPQYTERFNNFPLDIQRWDAIRYLILFHFGGVYIDFDYECIQNIESLLAGECNFAMEPIAHIPVGEDRAYFNNSLIATVPQNPFIEYIISAIYLKVMPTKHDEESELYYVSRTTGPYKLISLYDAYESQSDIHLIPAQYVSPLSKMEIDGLCSGAPQAELEQKLQHAYAIHYFAGTWLKK